MRAGTKYHPVCAAVKNKAACAERDRQTARERGAKSRLAKKTQAMQTPYPFSNFVSRSHEPNRPQKLCPLCCGMPWARKQNRLSDVKTGLEPVANDVGLCRGCGGSYAPEPKPEPVSVLGSSAGVAVREGQLHGMGHHEVPPKKRHKRGVRKWS